LDFNSEAVANAIHDTGIFSLNMALYEDENHANILHPYEAVDAFSNIYVSIEMDIDFYNEEFYVQVKL